MTILNTQTTLRSQTFYTIILLVLFSSFGIGKCYGVQIPEEDSPLVTTEVNGYLVMQPAPSSNTSKKAPGKCPSPSSNSQYVHSQQSNTYHQQYNQYDSVPEGHASVDDDNEYIQETGYHDNGSHYNDWHPNNLPNRQNNGSSIVSDNEQISSLVQVVPQYRLFTSMLHLLQDNTSSGNGSMPDNFQKAQHHSSITAGQLALYTNVANKEAQYQLTNHNHESVEAFYVLRNIYTETYTFGNNTQAINTQRTSITTTHTNTPAGMGEERGSVNHVAPESVMMTHHHIPSHHKIADQALDHNVTSTINTVAAASNITWIISIICNIFYLMCYCFNIIKKSCAGERVNIFPIALCT